MNIVIYARYSSHSQTEQSIEGQLQTCYDYAKNNGHTVIGEYIDRAQSGTSDSRAEFQRHQQGQAEKERRPGNLRKGEHQRRRQRDFGGGRVGEHGGILLGRALTKDSPGHGH